MKKRMFSLGAVLVFSTVAMASNVGANCLGPFLNAMQCAGGGSCANLQSMPSLRPMLGLSTGCGCAASPCGDSCLTACSCPGTCGSAGECSGACSILCPCPGSSSAAPACLSPLSCSTPQSATLSMLNLGLSACPAACPCPSLNGANVLSVIQASALTPNCGGVGMCLGGCPCP